MLEPVVGGVNLIFLKRNAKIRGPVVGYSVGDMDG
jgi:hypothetical protein